MPTPVAPNNNALDAIRPPEHPTRKIYTSVGEQLADLRRANAHPVDLDLIDLVGDKAKILTHLAKQLDITAAILAKRETPTQIDLASLQAVVNDIAQKDFGWLARKFPRKFHNDSLLDAKDLEIR
jgi:hypothetical protein